MSRLIAVATALASGLVLAGPLASPAVAMPTPICSGRVIEVGCGGTRGGFEGLGGDDMPSPSSNARWRVVVMERVPCWRLMWRSSGPGTTYDEALAQVPRDMPSCYVLAGEWDNIVPLPSPRPKIEPGNRALAGKRVFLELDMDGDWQHATPEVELRARPLYRIDWGDGSPATVTSSTGVAYPGGPGEITHVYRKAGMHTVTVEAQWSGEWRLPDQQWQQVPGELRTLGETDLVVQQLQAVRTR